MVNAPAPSSAPWWRFGFDGKALVKTVVGSVVGLIALLSCDYHVSLPHRQLQHLLTLLGSPQMAALLGRTSPQP